MQKTNVSQTVKECKHLSGYELTTLLIRNGKKLNLKSSELLVFMALASYWNGKPVYPKVSTLAENTTLSEKAVRTALNGLLEKGFILKSKRSKNANIYNINVSAVITTVESGKFYRSSTVNSTAPCNMKLYHEKLEETTTHEVPTPQIKSQANVVAFSQISSRKSKSVKLDEVPNIIKENKNIKNPCGYWATLTDEIKAEYIQKDKEREENRRKKIEFEKVEQERKAREQAELEEIRKQPPFWETCTRDEAVKHLRNFRNMGKLLYSGYRVELQRKFNIDLQKEVLF